MSSDAKLREASRLMAERLRLFRKIAEQAREVGGQVELDPSELWEQQDQAALDAYEEAVNEINGARPLFAEVP